MRTANLKTITLVVALLAITFSSGCTNWKKKYQHLNVEHENIKGLFDRERAEKRQLANQVSQGQQTISELQRKIEEQKQSPAMASGFGEGYEVSFDPAAGTLTVTLQNTILFNSGKAVLKKATITELDHILSVLQGQYAGKEIDVVGHTDADPIKKSPWKDNWELAAQRALSVVRYMVKHGFPPEKVRQAGCGEYRSIASNATTSGKSRNRRVEIVVRMR